MTLQERLQLFLGKRPSIDSSAYVAPSAVIIGDVRIVAQASLWPHAVLRGDINFIEIGTETNLQDGAIVHLSNDHPTRVGARVSVGHRAILHACIIHDECLIGMGAIVLDGAEIGEGSIVAAGALVPKDAKIPAESVVLGVPARVIRKVTAEERQQNRALAEKYIQVAAAHRQAERRLDTNPSQS